jgi:hypothetical protein
MARNLEVKKNRRHDDKTTITQTMKALQREASTIVPDEPPAVTRLRHEIATHAFQVLLPDKVKRKPK